MRYPATLNADRAEACDILFELVLVFSLGKLYVLIKVGSGHFAVESHDHNFVRQTPVQHFLVFTVMCDSK